MHWQSRLHEKGTAESDLVPTIPTLIAQVLRSRGLLHRWQEWLSPKLKDLRDPSSLLDMDKAVDRILECYKKQEAICIYADFDLDGTSGLALLKTGLQELGFKSVGHYQPRRLTEGYGVHAEAIRKLASERYRVVVTVDVGITAFAAAQAARESNIDLIITDHHLPQDQLPDAYAIVNPNRRECRSQLGHLSGAGVAFYLLMALKRAMQNERLLQTEIDLKNFLDFYIIGTLTDLVPMIEENRVLVRHGLLQLAQTQRPGLRALLNSLDMAGRNLGSQEVAIKFAPKLNALSRMENDILPIDIMLVDDENRARELVSGALSTNQQRLQMQHQAEAEAQQLAEQSGYTGFVWVWSKNFHRGVVGLVATKLAQIYHVPAFVGSCGKDNMITGSARAPEGSEHQLAEILGKAASVLRRHGGHAAAAGFELSLGEAQDFGRLLQTYFLQAQTSEAAPIIYDADGTLADFSDEFLRWFDWLEPFGTHFKPPVFRLNGVCANDVKSMRGGHLRMRLQDGKASAREGIWFSPRSSPDLLAEIKEGRRFDALVEGAWNHFRGRKTFQLVIRDIR